MKRLLLGLVVMAGCAGDGDCTVKDCATHGGVSGRTYTKCYYGISPIRTTLEDESGDVFYDCTDGTSETCTSHTVDAVFAYCEVQ